MMHKVGEPAASRFYQAIAVLLCVVLAVLMILNTQMGGEAMWFWYGTVFRQGARLYTDLHTALQPFFVLEISSWMRLFGIRIAVYETISLIHASLLAFGIYFVLRESDWSDWQKGILLLGTFVFTVAGHSYRFDDYHVLAETLIVYALLLLLLLGRPGEIGSLRRQYGLGAALGVLCGLTVVTRLTDGAALTLASVLSLPWLVTRRRLASVALFGAAAALTVLVVVKLTGDTLVAYASNSIFHAAGSKGGTGSIFAAPFRMVLNTLREASHQKRVLLCLCALITLAIVTVRYWKQGIRYIVPLQLALAALLALGASRSEKVSLENGQLFEDAVLFFTVIMYGVAAWIVLRLIRNVRKPGTWDPREVLILVPILEWASYSAGAAAQPLTNYYGPVAMLLLLIPILQPSGEYAAWLNPSVISIVSLLTISGIVSKVLVPYSWQNYSYPTMFTNREWFQHPVYGEMYIDRDLLHFSERVCRDIGAVPGKSAPQLLSLPYPYPNYFCHTPPWHNDVQTFFDTATRGTIEQMMRELQADPPQWIVYQRQLNIMKGSELLYNHGRPIVQRDLDKLIMAKLGAGQWTLVDQSDYLNQPVRPGDHVGDTGWYIIRTAPSSRPLLPMSQ